MIRYFEEKDLVFINELLKEFNYQLSDESFENNYLKVLVYEEDFIKGILIYRYIYDRIEIDYIVVCSKYRRMGISSKLLEFMENEYDNIKNITLEVKESNIGAIHFYKKNGFVEVAKRKNYYKEEDALLMMKSLGD